MGFTNDPSDLGLEMTDSEDEGGDVDIDSEDNSRLSAGDDSRMSDSMSNTQEKKAGPAAGAEDADDAPGLEEEGAGAQHCQLPQRGAEEPVQAGVARRPERHQTTRGWWLLVRGHGLCEWKTILLLNIQTFGVNVKYAKTLSCPSVLSAIILSRTIRFHMIAIQISCLTFLNLVLIEDAD